MSSSALIAGGKRPIVLGGGGMITKLLLLYPVIQRGGIANTRLLPLWTRPGLPLSPSRSLRTSSSILSCMQQKQRNIAAPFAPIHRIIGSTRLHTTGSAPPSSSSSGNTDKHRDVKDKISSSEILNQIARLEQTKMKNFEARLNKYSNIDVCLNKYIKKTEEGIKK